MADKMEESVGTADYISTVLNRKYEYTTLKPLEYEMTVSSRSYGDSLYMDEKTVDEAIEIVNTLAKELYQIFSDMQVAEDRLRKVGQTHGWWSAASNFSPEHFYNSKFLVMNDASNTNYPANKLLSIYHGTTGLDAYVSEPSFNGLVSAIEEIKQAIINYSNGVDVNSAKSSLFTWISTSGGDPSRFAPNSVYNAGVTSVSTAASDVVTPVAAPVEIPASTDIMDSSVIDFDEVDGADNIQIKDSVTDDILDISSDDLMKDSSSKGIPGIASIIGASNVSSGLAGAGVGAGSLGITGSDTLESLGDGIDTGLDGEDLGLSDLSSSVTGTISSFVAPNVNKATKEKMKSSSAGVAAALAGIGTLSAGGIGGKIYLDKKKKKDEDEEENDDEEFEFQDDDFFDNKDEEAQSVVDFKNDILSENE